MAGERQHQTKQPSEGMDPVLLLAMVGLVFLMGAVLWWKYHQAVTKAYGTWRLITNFPAWLFGEYVANVPVLVRPFHDAWAYFHDVNYAEVELHTLFDTSWPVNLALLLGVMLPLAWRSISVSLRTNPLNHRNFGKPKDFTVFTFMKAQEKVYPHLKLYGALNMLKQPINEGRLRMPDTEKQFVLGHHLVSREATADKIVIDRDRATAVFRGQIGPYWRGLEKLSVQELVLFGAFAPKAAACDPKMSDDEYEEALDTSAKLLKDFWLVFSPDANGHVPSGRKLLERLAKSPVCKEAVASAKRYASNRLVAGVVGRHAYVATVLYELLDAARKTGVLPSAEFRWLKLVDRRLWLVLNTVGRCVAFPEVGGVYAHYLYELKAKRATEKLMVETATDALQGAFDKLIFTEAEWTKVEDLWAEEDRAAEAAA
jgi:hypothetical protein